MFCTVPICDAHWYEQHTREPVRVVLLDPEPCYLCGQPSNIYVRANVGVPARN